jgi:hypothetical protein
LEGLSILDAASKLIGIDDIDKLAAECRLYILVAGGIAVGKTHVVREHIHAIPVMDVDDVMGELGYWDYTNHDQFSEAMNIIGSRIIGLMDEGKSLISMGTGSHLPFAVDRLLRAKLRGYITVLLHIEAEPGQQDMQNEERRLKHKRYVRPEQHARIAETRIGAAEVVKLLKDTELVDFFAHYQNIRI